MMTINTSEWYIQSFSFIWIILVVALADVCEVRGGDNYNYSSSILRIEIETDIILLCIAS